MQPFRYSDEHIDENEFMFAFPSIVIGVAVLTLPAQIANATLSSDGWISILISGILFTVFALLGLKVATSFPNKSFYDYSSHLVTKPIAIMFIFVLSLSFLMILSYSVSLVSFVTQRYMFVQTPMEAIGLIFLLVIVYAVSGSRVGLFRLNMLFLPLILLVFLIVSFFNFKYYELQNILPLFKTDIKGYLKGINKSFNAFGGFSIVLFYTYLIYKPKNLSKTIIIGMSIPTIVYIGVFFMCIAMFGNLTTGNLLYPTIEAAKRVDIPGAIFERVDAFVFTIWIMAFFNTAVMMLDIIVILICSVFKKANKQIVIFTLSPIIFYLAMFPQQVNLSFKIGTFIGQIHTFFVCFIIISLFLMVKIRGVSYHEKP